MQAMLDFGGWVMALFSLIFLFYTHSFLIRRRKKELGIGNAELAAMSGVPKATIDKITSGATTNPSLETMKSIAHALNVSLDAFDDEPAVDAERRAKEQELLAVVNALGLDYSEVVKRLVQLKADTSQKE